MIWINEWFPNPHGADTNGEFIELLNDGGSAANLSGWTITTSGKKSFRFGTRTIPAGGYLLLSHGDTKLSLKNNGDTVSLYDAQGRLIDRSSYLGAAPDGQSFSRVYYPSSTDANGAVPESFAWGTPTPGAPNKVDLHNGLSIASYPINQPIGHASALAGPFGLVELCIGICIASAILALLVVYSLKSDEDISNLCFPRDGGIRE